MGLRIKPEYTEVVECPSWSYSGFSRFRKLLAESLGWPEWGAWYDETVKAFMENRQSDLTDCPKPPSDSWLFKAVRPFLNHSDCDGYLSGRNLDQLDDAVEAATNLNPLANSDYDLEQAKLLVKVIRICKANNEKLIWT